MNKRIVRAALVACLLGSAAILAATAPLSPAFAADAPTENKVSTPVGKTLQPAAKLMEANDNAGALVLIKQAQALPDQTPFDTWKINEFLGNVYVRLNDHVNAEIAFTAMAESPAMEMVTPEERSNTYRIAGLLATEQKHYDQGIKFDQAFLALGKPDPVVLASMAQAYYYKDDLANAAATAQKAVDATPPGQPPNEGALQIMFGAQLKAKNTEAAVATLEKIVTYYDEPDQWGQLIDVSFGIKGIKDVDALHLYRLRLLSKAPAHSEDYTLSASMALAIGYPVEADAILQAGSGVVDTSGKNGALIADARRRAATDRSTIAGFDGIAKKAASGELDLKLAETYYGYGRYAESAEAAQRAITKGGAKVDANEANMVMGESLLRQGKVTEALAAFNAVHNAGPGMTKAQHLWVLYASRKPTAAATP